MIKVFNKLVRDEHSLVLIENYFARLLTRTNYFIKQCGCIGSYLPFLLKSSLEDSEEICSHDPK